MIINHEKQNLTHLTRQGARCSDEYLEPILAGAPCLDFVTGRRHNKNYLTVKRR